MGPLDYRTIRAYWARIKERWAEEQVTEKEGELSGTDTMS